MNRIKCIRAEAGVAAVEFALVLPFLLLMLIGALETGRAMIISQRVEKAAYVIADITSQYPPATQERNSGEINEAELRDNVFPQLGRIMGNYSAQNLQRVILTSVYKEGGVKRIKWQAAGGGSLSSGVTSVVNGVGPGAVGPSAMNQPTAFADPDVEAELSTMQEGENMIVAEVFFRYNPIWTQVTGGLRTAAGEDGKPATLARPKVLAKRMYFRPRHGYLECLPPSFEYTPCIPPPPPPPPGSGVTSCDDNCGRLRVTGEQWCERGNGNSRHLCSCFAGVATCSHNAIGVPQCNAVGGVCN